MRTRGAARRANGAQTETRREERGAQSPLVSPRINPSPSWISSGLVPCSPPDKPWTYHSYHGNIPSVRSAPWIYAALMETMSPQQGTMGQNRSDSLTGESKALPDNKKVPATPAMHRRHTHGHSCASSHTRFYALIDD